MFRWNILHVCKVSNCNSKRYSDQLTFNTVINENTLPCYPDKQNVQLLKTVTMKKF